MTIVALLNDHMGPTRPSRFMLYIRVEDAPDHAELL